MYTRSTAPMVLDGAGVPEGATIDNNCFQVLNFFSSWKGKTAFYINRKLLAKVGFLAKWHDFVGRLFTMFM